MDEICRGIELDIISLFTNWITRSGEIKLDMTSPSKFETTQTPHHQRNNLKVAIKSNPLSHGNHVQISPGDTNTSVGFHSVCLIPAAATGLKTTVPHSLRDNSLPTVLFCIQTFSFFSPVTCFTSFPFYQSFITSKRPCSHMHPLAAIHIAPVNSRTYWPNWSFPIFSVSSSRAITKSFLTLNLLLVLSSSNSC